MMRPGFLTHPEGVQAFADSFPGAVANVVQGQSSAGCTHLDHG